MKLSLIFSSSHSACELVFDQQISVDFNTTLILDSSIVTWLSSAGLPCNTSTTGICFPPSRTMATRNFLEASSTTELETSPTQQVNEFFELVMLRGLALERDKWNINVHYWSVLDNSGDTNNHFDCCSTRGFVHLSGWLLRRFLQHLLRRLYHRESLSQWRHLFFEHHSVLRLLLSVSFWLHR